MKINQIPNVQIQYQISSGQLSNIGQTSTPKYPINVKL